LRIKSVLLLLLIAFGCIGGYLAYTLGPSFLFVAWMTIAPKQTPPPILDSQFRLTRQPLPDNTNESMLFPPQLAKFKRVGDQVTIDKISAYEYRLANGASLTLSVRYGANKQDLEGADGWVSCGDASVPAKLHLDPPFPYSFSNCGGFNISWINGKWFLQVVTSSSPLMTPEDFINFVNSYPY